MRPFFHSLLRFAATSALLLGACSSEPQIESPAPVEVLRLADGNVSLYKQGDFWAFRRNNWSLYGWIDALRRTRAARTKGSPAADSGAVLVCFDSHSDLHPPPVCPNPDSLRAGDPAAASRYIDRLSVASFRLPSLHYGFVQEMYWVQPDITPFQGPEETIRFRTVERDGWILPAVRAGATLAELESLGVRTCQGGPVPRSADLAAAFRALPEGWEPGPLTLHCLSLRQLADKVKAGVFRNRPVLVDLDLDYFGTGGALRGYGYLGFFPRSHVATGLLGGILPVFYMSLPAMDAEAARVREVVQMLDPVCVTMCESPDHSHRETLPRLVQYFRRGLVRPGADAAAGPQPEAVPPAVSLEVAGGRTVLSPDCPAEADLGGADSLALAVQWPARVRDSLEVSLYFDPAGSRDRRMARFVVLPGSSRSRFPLLPPGREAPAGAAPRNPLDWLGTGWDCDLRNARTGVLLWSAAFVLEDGTLRLGRVLRDLAARGRLSGGTVPDDPAYYLDLPPSRIIEAGRIAGLTPQEIHRILLADPRAQEWQCRNLRRFREGFGTVRTATADRK